MSNLGDSIEPVEDARSGAEPRSEESQDEIKTVDAPKEKMVKAAPEK